MARVAPEDAYAGLADPALLARDIPDLDLADPAFPSPDELEKLARRAEEAWVFTRRNVSGFIQTVNGLQKRVARHAPTP